jgi:hypothetical protein
MLPTTIGVTMPAKLPDVLQMPITTPENLCNMQ